MSLSVIIRASNGWAVDVKKYKGNLNDAVSAIGDTKVELVVGSAVVITSNLVIPPNIQLTCKVSGIINNSGYSLTINGPFEAGNYPVFSGSGATVFGSFITAINPDWSAADTDGAKVQWAVNTASGSGWTPMEVGRVFDLATPVIIDRAIDSTDQEFRIIAFGTDAGFSTSQPINMFSSTLIRLVGTDYHPSSEFVTFEGVRFESSLNTVNNYVLDGNKFLRMKFLNCFFKSIRLATTTQYFQSFYLDHYNIRFMKGKFLESVIGAGGIYSGKAMDMKITNGIYEFGDRTTESAFMVLGASASGCDLTGNLFENSTGPFFKTGGASGVNISGNYYEDTDVSPIQLGQSPAVNITGNLFTDNATAIADPNYYDIDCQTSYSVNSSGNYTNGKLYKELNMITTTGTYGLDGLVSNGDFATIALSDMRFKNRDRFTVTLTGLVTPIDQYLYVVRNGNIITMTILDITSGTSNTTGMTITGVPVGWLPKSPMFFPVTIIDNGVTSTGSIYIGPAGITFSKSLDSLGFSSFTASGTKGIPYLSITYSIYP